MNPSPFLSTTLLRRTTPLSPRTFSITLLLPILAVIRPMRPSQVNLFSLFSLFSQVNLIRRLLSRALSRTLRASRMLLLHNQVLSRTLLLHSPVSLTRRLLSPVNLILLLLSRVLSRTLLRHSPVNLTLLRHHNRASRTRPLLSSRTLSRTLRVNLTRPLLPSRVLNPTDLVSRMLLRHHQVRSLTLPRHHQVRSLTLPRHHLAAITILPHPRLNSTPLATTTRTLLRPIVTVLCCNKPRLLNCFHHKLSELLLVYLAIAVRVRRLDHLLQLLFLHIDTQLTCDFLQIV